MEATCLKDYLATRLGILKEWALRASTVDHPPIYTVSLEHFLRQLKSSIWSSLGPSLETTPQHSQRGIPKQKGRAKPSHAR